MFFPEQKKSKALWIIYFSRKEQIKNILQVFCVASRLPLTENQVFSSFYRETKCHELLSLFLAIFSLICERHWYEPFWLMQPPQHCHVPLHQHHTFWIQFEQDVIKHILFYCYVGQSGWVCSHTSTIWSGRSWRFLPNGNFYQTTSTVYPFQIFGSTLDDQGKIRRDQDEWIWFMLGI